MCRDDNKTNQPTTDNITRKPMQWQSMLSWEPLQDNKNKHVTKQTGPPLEEEPPNIGLCYLNLRLERAFLDNIRWDHWTSTSPPPDPYHAEHLHHHSHFHPPHHCLWQLLEVAGHQLSICCLTAKCLVLMLGSHEIHFFSFWWCLASSGSSSLQDAVE